MDTTTQEANAGIDTDDAAPLLTRNALMPFEEIAERTAMSLEEVLDLYVSAVNKMFAKCVVDINAPTKSLKLSRFGLDYIQNLKPNNNECRKPAQAARYANPERWRAPRMTAGGALGAFSVRPASEAELIEEIRTSGD